MRHEYVKSRDRGEEGESGRSGDLDRGEVDGGSISLVHRRPLLQLCVASQCVHGPTACLNVHLPNFLHKPVVQFLICVSLPKQCCPPYLGDGCVQYRLLTCVFMRAHEEGERQRMRIRNVTLRGLFMSARVREFYCHKS